MEGIGRFNGSEAVPRSRDIRRLLATPMERLAVVESESLDEFSWIVLMLGSDGFHFEITPCKD